MGSAARRSVPHPSASLVRQYPFKEYSMSRLVLAFVGEIYEDLELWYPKLRVEEAGFVCKLAGEELRTYSGKHGYPAKADTLISDALSKDFAGLLIPGGFMPDKIRRNQKALQLT